MRGDLQRCLIVCPGSLAEQWQDELDRRFHLPFEIMTNDKLEAARTGNWFAGEPAGHLPARQALPQRGRAGEAQADRLGPDRLRRSAQDCSATFFGSEVKYTKRYRLGQLLSTLTRHFLLMTATPHNGKEEDFQLFLALLDGDRFEGKFRDGVHKVDVSDLMRRMVKEQLLKFDGTPLFPERIAYTVNYKLSDAEADLYKEVTDYVREEFNRAEAWRTRAARARSASPSPSCSAGSPPRPRPSTSRCAAAASGWRSGSAKSNSEARRRGPPRPRRRVCPSYTRTT